MKKTITLLLALIITLNLTACKKRDIDLIEQGKELGDYIYGKELDNLKELDMLNYMGKLHYIDKSKTNESESHSRENQSLTEDKTYFSFNTDWGDVPSKLYINVFGVDENGNEDENYPLMNDTSQTRGYIDIVEGIYLCMPDSKGNSDTDFFNSEVNFIPVPNKSLADEKETIIIKEPCYIEFKKGMVYEVDGGCRGANVSNKKNLRRFQLEDFNTDYYRYTFKYANMVGLDIQPGKGLVIANTDTNSSAMYEIADKPIPNPNIIEVGNTDDGGSFFNKHRVEVVDLKEGQFLYLNNCVYITEESAKKLLKSIDK